MNGARKYKTGWSVTSVYLEDDEKQEIQQYCARRKLKDKGYSMGEYFRELGRRDRRRRHYALTKAGRGTA